MNFCLLFCSTNPYRPVAISVSFLAHLPRAAASTPRDEVTPQSAALREGWSPQQPITADVGRIHSEEEVPFSYEEGDERQASLVEHFI